jgi:hypothetical protein
VREIRAEGDPTVKWQIGGGGWPVNGGATLIPAGTIVDGEPPTWNHMVLSLPNDRRHAAG